MKALVLLLFLIFSLTASGQNFRKDWNFFRLRTGWYLTFSKDRSPYFNTKKTQGHMTFTSSKDSNISVTYHVYLKSEMDTSFQNKIKNWFIIQNCIDVFSGAKEIRSFDYGDYHYLIEPCANCDAKKNKECEMLAQDILDFVNGK